jgi:ABC-type long-subunit fatty acid transport system fused permease/ATPase subunit
MAAVGFFRGLEYRLLYAADGALHWALAGLVIALVIGVPWAGLPGTAQRVEPT